MVDFSTKYMGLTLRNPIIAASSPMTGTLKGVQKCAEAGAGAIVLRSLFEEQIAAEIDQLVGYADHAEAAEYLQGYGMELGPREYLDLLREAKKTVDVPIIASLNCISTRRWVEYAQYLESSGADAIELNVALMPSHSNEEGAAIESLYYRILHEVKSRVGIPVAMKIGPYFSGFANFGVRLTADLAEGPEFSVGWFGRNTKPGKIIYRGADALVLFNRHYRFDIDIDNIKLVAANPFSTSAESHISLRWISLLAGKIHGDLAANTGIHDGKDIVKHLLAGATAVQVCSTLFLNGVSHISKMLEEVQSWMQGHGFSSLGEFRGLLSQVRSDHPENYERLQYIKVLGGK